MQTRLLDTHALSDRHGSAIRRLLDDAFAGDFTDEDWQHALGGWRALIEEAGQVVAHAAVVERPFLVALMRERFELGALSSGEWGFYQRLGWERRRGPTWVRRADGQTIRTPDEDEGVMVLRTGRSGPLDLREPIVCNERVGDSW